MAWGDQTVPLLSAKNPGSNIAPIWYADSNGHMDLLHRNGVIIKVMRLLKGDVYSSVPGIRTT